MKKNYFKLLLVLLCTTTFAQQAYYNDVDLNLTGMPLKDALATKVINTHTNTLSYTPGVWEACKITDSDPNNSSNVLLIYGWENGSDSDVTNDLSRSKSNNGGNVGDWNREHTYAKSLGNPNLGTSGPGADAHHLRPADVQRNSSRGSLKFVTGSGNSGSVSGGWYPGDQWKGDVARMMMYMYIRYGNRCLPSGVAIGTSNSMDANMINLLLEWNAQDPPSVIEDNRNNYHDLATSSTISSNSNYAQGNRNPFIDEPYLATLIWGGTPALDRWGIFGGTSDTQAPTVPTNLAVSNETTTTIDLNWTASTDDTAVTSYYVYVDGTYNSSSTTTSTTVSGLNPSTTYSFTVLAIDAANNQSAQSSAVNGTTLATGTGNGGSDLIFSEYIEGSSSNKALEIANITDSPIDLSIYAVKLSSNGATDWGNATFNFPSINLANGDVFVIGNSSLAICTGVVDATSNVTYFGGNDVLGLFKNNVLIDIIGVLGSTSNFAKNVTLVRNPDITAPNTTYTPSEWTSYPEDTCSDLGSHTTTLGIQYLELSKIKIYPNPTSENNISISSDIDLTVEVFTILGKSVLKEIKLSNNTNFDISSLKTGVYFIKLTSDKGSIIKKFIKN